MKKRFVRRAGLFGIVLAMAVGLCACGKNSDGMENAALAKENVYKLQEITMPELYEEGKGSLGVQATGYADGRVMLLVQVWHWDSSSADQDLRLITVAEDGSDLQIKQLEMPASQEESQNEAEKPLPPAEEEDEEESGAADVDNDVMIPADEDFPVDDDFGYSNTYDYTSFERFLMTSTGQIYGIKRVVHEDWGNRENSYVHNSLVYWDSEGRLKDEMKLEGLESSEEEYFYVNTMAEAKDGSVYLIIGGNDTYYKMNVGKDGRISGRKEISDSAQTLFRYYERVIPSEPGQLYVVYRDEDDWSKMFGASYDLETDAVSGQVELPSMIRSSWNYSLMVKGFSSDLLYTTESGIYTYKIGDAEGRPKMDFVNSDLYISEFYTVVELSENSFLGIYTEDWGSDVRAGLFTYVRPEDIVDKKTLVLAGSYIPDRTKKRVIEYNRNNQEYRIVLRSYQQYNSEENEWMGATTQLNNEIISGKMPDILIGNTELPIENYISKGLIADVGKLIENDEELSRVEFLQNVFDAYSISGKLYYVIPDFYVSTMVAKDSLTSGRNNWSMNDMEQVLAGMGENAMAMGETTRDRFMNMVMAYCGNQFVDLSTGKCSFNTDNFIRMMEFAKGLPKEINYDNMGDDSYWEDYWSNYQSQYRENRTLLMPCYISGFEYIVENIKGYFGDDFAFVGFPTENGGSSYVQCNNPYVLSAKSSNLDEAWNFVRYYLSEEYQKDLRIPVRKELFLEKAKRMTERPYWEDENGKKEYYDYTTWINDEMIILEPFTEEQLNRVTEFIQSVNTRYYYDREIMKIMEEEMEAFFSGQKSAAEVADIIQRRAQMYVDTNR